MKLDFNRGLLKRNIKGKNSSDQRYQDTALKKADQLEEI